MTRLAWSPVDGSRFATKAWGVLPRSRSRTQWSGLAAGPTFSPLSLAPAVWYDFSAIGLADNAAIASINDLSGNSRTATQATGANQPIFKTAIQNGLGVGRFDGVNDTLSTASFSLAQPCVVYATIGQGNGRYFASHDASLRCGWNTSLGHDHYAGTVFQVTNASAVFKQVTVVFNGVSSIARANGAQDGTGAAGAGGIATGVDIGATAGVQFWAGDIGEVFMVSGSSISTSAENYLRTKWGTP